MEQRQHRWTDNYQFWFGLISIIFIIIGGIWHMSSRLTTIERNIATQAERNETGFKHVSRAIDTLNYEKTRFDDKVNDISF